MCGLCDIHLHQRKKEQNRSTVGYHVKDEHGEDPDSIESNFEILKKCQCKLGCLIFEMRFIRKLNQTWTNRVTRSARSYLLSVSWFMPQIFFVHCFYLNILEFSSFLISIFMINCTCFSPNKTFTFQLENDRRKAETSFFFNVNFCSEIKKTYFQQIAQPFNWVKL